VIRFDEGLVVDLSRKLDLLEIIFECHGSHQSVGWNNAEFVNEGEEVCGAKCGREAGSYFSEVREDRRGVLA
jgi:hypothetical protein